jgi:hypothetical protein
MSAQKKELNQAMDSRYGKLVLERLIDVLSCGPKSQHPWSLQILQMIFETPALNQHMECQLLADPRLTHSVAAYLETDRGQQVLQVMPIMWLLCGCSHTMLRLLPADLLKPLAGILLRLPWVGLNMERGGLSASTSVYGHAL